MEMDFTVREKGLTAAASAFDEIARSSLPDAYKKANLVTLAGNYGNALFGATTGSSTNNKLIEVTRRYLGESWFSNRNAAELATMLARKDPESGVADLDRFTNAKAKELYALSLIHI